MRHLVVLGGRLRSGSRGIIGSGWAPVKATQLPLGEKKGDPIAVGGEEGDGGWVGVVLGLRSGTGEERMRQGERNGFL
jgi:hypothetical protein